MGIALMMEGVLSACYHVCPNYSNFQFDTSFMYMIAGLCMLKLYQTRHPDINASAYSAYASFAVVISLAVLGVVFGKNDMWFWVIFSMIHVLASLALSTQIYYMGRFKIDMGIFRRAVMVLYTDCIQQCSRPMYMDRMVLLIVGNLVNWSFAIFGLLYRPRDFASYILGIFICNLLLYLAFYIIMKLRSSEKLLPIPMFCIVATAVVWAAALYFFFQTLSSWEVNFPFALLLSISFSSSFLPGVLHKNDSGEESWAAHGELKGFNSFSRLVKEHGKMCWAKNDCSCVEAVYNQVIWR
uniref:Uncharacterized protein n=1 Tax=Ficedula albicollis TaxID=59894 RepID=U3JRD5_FICAL